MFEKGGGDDCEKVADKTMPIVAEMAKSFGKEVKPEDRAKMVEKCRTALKDGHRDPAMDCILAAADEAAVRACITKGMGDYQAKSKASEGKVMLKMLEKRLKMAAVEKAALPTGKVGPTPATPCCKQPDQKCPPTPADWADPTWQALEFQIDEPMRFQYSYESDGKIVTATATGDLACDGHATTLTLKRTLDNGQPVFEPIAE